VPKTNWLPHVESVTIALPNDVPLRDVLSTEDEIIQPDFLGRPKTTGCMCAEVRLRPAQTAIARVAVGSPPVSLHSCDVFSIDHNSMLTILTDDGERCCQLVNDFNSVAGNLACSHGWDAPFWLVLRYISRAPK
jgi:hypothetical protein